MVQALNTNYIEPSAVALPEYRLGPLGDAAKINCTTCHQGVYKPLYGANMLEDFPSLKQPNQRDRQFFEPGLADPATSMEIGQEIDTARADAAAEDAAADDAAADDAAADEAAADGGTDQDAAADAETAAADGAADGANTDTPNAAEGGEGTN
jgi:hypothetical protein